MSYPSRKEALTHRIDRPRCLENPRPQGGIFPLLQFSALLFTLSQNSNRCIRLRDLIDSSAGVLYMGSIPVQADPISPAMEAEVRSALVEVREH